MANNRDLLIQLIIKAIGAAAAESDVEGLSDKVKELAKAISDVGFTAGGKDIQSFGEAVKSATDPVAQATAKTLAFQAALTGLATVLIERVYQASKSYESSLADLGKVLDNGVEGAKQYGAQLDQTALKFAQNGENLVSAMAGFKQGGFEAQESFKLVEDAVRLMISGELDAAESSAYLVSILKGFQAPASEAGKTVDILNEVSNRYATNVKELAVGMAALSPIAKQMGFSMEETAGLLTPAIEVYRSGSEAADALKTSLQQLTNDTKPVKAALASLGVSQIDLNGQLRSGKDIFLDVARAMIGLTDAQKSYVTQQLVGIEQSGRFGTVLNDLNKYLAVADTALNSAGSAAKEVATRLDTAEASAAKADESFRQLAVSLGDKFKPQIRGVVDATGELAAAFNRSIKAGDLAPLLNVIKPQIASIEALVRAMAGNLESALSGVDWHPLVDGIKTISTEFGDAFAKLTEGLDLTTVEGLRALLQSIINLLGNFSQFVGGAIDGLEPFFGALNTLYQAISQNSPALSNLAGEIAGLATSANQIIPVISTVGSTIFGALGGVAELTLKIGLLVVALRLLSAAGIPVVAILGRLATAFLSLSPGVASVVAALAGFPGVITALVTGVGALGYGLGTLINKFVEWATGGRSVGSMLADLVDKITGANDAVTRSATPEELAIARAKRLAAEKKAQADATKKAAEEEQKARETAEAGFQAQLEKIKLHAQEQETIDRLQKYYTALGLVYDATTGKILRQNEQTAQQLQQARELGDALDKLGVKANYMADRITAGGAESIATFRSVTQNAQATAAQIEAAFKAAINSAETEAEVKKLLEAYQEWASGAGKNIADVVSATGLADTKTKELKKSVEGVSEASRLYAAAGVDALEIKRLEALAAGDLVTALAIEKQQREAAAKSTRDQSDEVERLTEIQERNTQVTKDNAETLAKWAEETKAQSSVVTGTFNGWIDRLNALSPAAVTAFEKLQGFTDSTVESTDATTEARAALDQLGETISNLGDSGYVEWANQLAYKAQTIEARFWGQAEAAEAFEQQLNSLKAGNQLEGLIRQAEDTRASFDLLDQTRLDQLNNAIDTAKGKMSALRDETETARLKVMELDEQEARLEGNTALADSLKLQREYFQDLSDAEANRAAAAEADNQTLIDLYDQQITRIKRIYELEKESGSSKSTSSSTSSASSSSSSGGSSSSGVSITVNASGARVLDSGFVNDLARQLTPVLSGIRRRLA